MPYHPTIHLHPAEIPTSAPIRRHRATSMGVSVKSGVGCKQTSGRCQRIITACSNGNGRKVVRVRPENPKYKTLLSIDGGGVRGIVPAVVLETVESTIVQHIKENDLLPEDAKGAEVTVDLADYFDCIAGTSVGSIIATYLASKGGTSHSMFRKMGWDDVRPGSVAGIVRTIFARAGEVFRKRWYEGLGFAMRGLVNGSMKPAKYNSNGVERVLKDVFGDLTLRDVHTALFVPAIDMEADRGFAFWSEVAAGLHGYAALTSQVNGLGIDVRECCKEMIALSQGINKASASRGAHLVPNNNYYLWQVARASSAAPTFFPAATFAPVSGNAGQKTFTDGGDIAKNPTLSALSFIESQMGTPAQDVATLSIGTGHAVLDHPLDGGGEVTSFATTDDDSAETLQALVENLYYERLRLPRGQYIRVNVSAGGQDDDRMFLETMDKPENMGRLYEIGKEVTVRHKRAIADFVRDFVFEENTFLISY